MFFLFIDEFMYRSTPSKAWHQRSARMVKKASKHVKSDVANVGFPALRVDIDNPLATGGSEQDRKSNLEKEMIKTFLFFVFFS